MKKEYTGRGFEIVKFMDRTGSACSLQQSSAICPETEDKRESAYENPGSSAVWFGPDNADPKIMASKTTEGGIGWVPYSIPEEVSLTTRAHLTRSMVKELIEHLQSWLDTGHFKE